MPANRNGTSNVMLHLQLMVEFIGKLRRRHTGDAGAVHAAVIRIQAAKAPASHCKSMRNTTSLYIITKRTTAESTVGITSAGFLAPDYTALTTSLKFACRLVPLVPSATPSETTTSRQPSNQQRRAATATTPQIRTTEKSPQPCVESSRFGSFDLRFGSRAGGCYVTDVTVPPQMTAQESAYTLCSGHT